MSATPKSQKMRAYRLPNWRSPRHSRPFVTANIIGATNLDQLAENIASIDITLSDDTLAAIDTIHADISNPCP